MGEELTTQPTLETLLEMMRGMRDEMRAGFEAVNKRLDAVEQRLDAVEERLERIETRMDRVESIALEGHADLRDLKKQLREHLPALK
jgi:septal ring factor EnvC (AmiA/AmiB activator)